MVRCRGRVVLAVAGPVSVVGGIVVTLRERISLSGGTPPLPGRVRYLSIAVAIAFVGWYWLSRRSTFRAAARRSAGWLPLAVVASIFALTFWIGTAMGLWTWAFAGLAVGGLPALPLLTDNKPRTPQQ